MPHVGVKRLCASNRENDGAHREERLQRMFDHEADCGSRQKTDENVRVQDDLAEAAKRRRDKPKNHDRSEKTAKCTGATSLDKEKAGEYEEGDRDHKWCCCWRDDLHSFDGREDRNSRRNDTVATEERDAENANECKKRQAFFAAAGLPNKPDKRHDAAFAVVVDAHKECHVFDRHDEGDRPQNERNNALYVART